MYIHHDNVFMATATLGHTHELFVTCCYHSKSDQVINRALR